jgi:hypothetical protein
MKKLIVIPAKGRLMVVGDVHGDIASLEAVLEKFHRRNGNLLFLGDYGDRGPNSYGVYEELFGLLKRYPERVYLLKGNHEQYVKEGWTVRPNFYPHDFFDYLERYKPKELPKYFSFWESLPICALVPGKYLFLHGGVSSKIRSLNDLESPSEEIESDILWSDPAVDIASGEYYNERGAGVVFGKDITKKVCESIGVKTIVRSHQPNITKGGIAIHHDNMLLTLSSTTSYGGVEAAYLTINLEEEAKDAYELSKCTHKIGFD